MHGFNLLPLSSRPPCGRFWYKFHALSEQSTDRSLCLKRETKEAGEEKRRKKQKESFALFSLFLFSLTQFYKDIMHTKVFSHSLSAGEREKRREKKREKEREKERKLLRVRMRSFHLSLLLLLLFQRQKVTEPKRFTPPQTSTNSFLHFLQANELGGSFLSPCHSIASAKKREIVFSAIIESGIPRQRKIEVFLHRLSGITCGQSGCLPSRRRRKEN